MTSCTRSRAATCVERPGHTLQATALVNEAYLRLIDVKQVRWQNRAHFLAMAARVMRRILVDSARARRFQKRGGGAQMGPLDPDHVAAGRPGRDLVALDDALTALASMDPRKSQVVEMRFFGGLTADETAEALHVSAETVKRDWRLGRRLLSRCHCGTATAQRHPEKVKHLAVLVGNPSRPSPVDPTRSVSECAGATSFVS